jgi:hypothetical protein
LRIFGTYVAGCLVVVWNVHVFGFQTYQGPLNEPICPVATVGPTLNDDVASATDADSATTAAARAETMRTRLRAMILNSLSSDRPAGVAERAARVTRGRNSRAWRFYVTLV